MMDVVNSIMMYYNNLCKCHNVPPHSTIRRKKKERKNQKEGIGKNIGHQNYD
jgi:hypothetical protein